MANFCLPRDRVEKFVNGLKSGEIDAEKLAKMSSEERNTLLGKYVGEGAASQVNAEFESKLLLKNQNQGFATWIRDTAGLKPEVKRDMLGKVQRLDKVLTQTESDQFLHDLVERRLGADLTPGEYDKVAQMSKNIADLEGKRSYANEKLTNVNDLAKYDYKPSDADAQYGKALADFRDYTSELKNESNKVSRADFKGSTGKLRSISHAVRSLADLSKALGASLDNSWFGRQGNTLALTHPFIWGKQFVESFGNIKTSLLEKGSAHGVEDATHAYLMSDPMYKQAIKDGLPLSGAKDVFPTSLPGKIKGVGRAFKASEAAYGAAHDLSMFSAYKQLMKKAASQGVDLSEKNASKNIASLVASMTGAGNLGHLERVGGVLNVLLYSARFLKSNIDQLLLHPLGHGVGGTIDAMLGREGAKAISFGQKEAAVNLAKVVTGLAGVLVTANALQPGSVDFDPRSTDFGKIRIGDTRFDISGGKGSLLTLAAKFATQSAKSSSSGKISQLNTGKRGDQTTGDVLGDFMLNKASPLGGVMTDVLLRGWKDGVGNPTTPASEAARLVTPLGVNNLFELLNNPKAAPVLAGVIADGLGISSNTYSPSGGGQTGNSSWSQSGAQDIAAFKQHVNQQTFDTAGKQFDDRYNSWISDTRNQDAYKNMSPVEQAGLITKEKNKIQKQIFADNGFTYKAPKVDKNKYNTLLK